MKILIYIITFLYFVNISLLDFNWGNFYFIVIFLSFFILLFLGIKKLELSYSFLLLLISILFSIIFNDIPDYFSPYLRFLAFIIVLLLVSPIINTDKLQLFRIQLFYLINLVLCLLSILSLLVFILDIDTKPEGRTDFNGLFTHSMVLGPIASFNVIYFFIKAISIKNIRYKYLFFLLAFICFLSSLASGSRTAILCLLIGLVFLFFKLRKKFRLFFLRYSLIGVFILFLFNPFLTSISENLIGKFEYSEKEDDITASRSLIWAERVDEFISSPIIGIGFASVSTKLSDRFETDAGRIEPGSSWLAILSMTGILGFICFLIFMFSYFKIIFLSTSNNSEFLYLCSLLIMFLLHMFSEGYIFSAGSPMFFLFWLVLGNLRFYSKLYR